MPEISSQSGNPLQKYFRQPKVYLNLPSKGNFYRPGSLEMPETGEFPVFAMTARDELTMKTPDALLNGQATVDVIKSCIPAIKDPWGMPSLDIDAVLIAIRVATYGETLTVTQTVPGINEERDYQIDLRKVLQDLTSHDFDPEIQVGDMLITVRPLTYSEFTKASLATFEEQRILTLVNNDQISDEEKMARFNQAFTKLTDLTVASLSKSIASITINGEVVDSPVHIEEFIQNVDKEFYTTIMDHIEEQRNKFQIKPLKVSLTPDDIERGAPESFEIPVTFDQSNFFE